MGLDVYLTKGKAIELDSKKYPEHLFKIGYFRSSYNEGGVNSYLQRYGLKNLYEVFGVGDKDSDPAIDWEESKKRIVELLSEFKQKIERGEFSIDCMFVSKNILDRSVPSVKCEEDAIKVYQEQTKSETPFEWYSNIKGRFFRENLPTVLAVIPGYGFLSTEGVYLIYKCKDRYKWYLEALEIVEETIDYVLSQEDHDKYRLSWSF